MALCEAIKRSVASPSEPVDEKMLSDIVSGAWMSAVSIKYPFGGKLIRND